MSANYSQTRQIFLSLAGNGMINFQILFICTVFGGLPLLFHLLSNSQENPVTESPGAPFPTSSQLHEAVISPKSVKRGKKPPNDC